MSYPIEFCGNCGVGKMTKDWQPCYCDYFQEGTVRRCNSWVPGKDIAYNRIVYICSPCHPAKRYMLRAAAQKISLQEVLEENLRRAEAYCLAAVESHAIPVAPHLLFTRFLDEFNQKHRTIGLECALALMERCDELWVFGDTISHGMKHEIELATDMGRPIIRIPQEKADEIAASYRKGESEHGH